MAEFVKVCKVSDIPQGTGKCVEVAGKAVALFRVDGDIHAIKNLCPHQGGPLADGMMDGKEVLCPWHEWRFDVVSGNSSSVPRARVRTYNVKVEGEDVLLDPE
ncbi:MAG: hypothetical protein A2Z34_02760 [Planctomycetes bacterium RBG_16_59_8]|nr:MAG: hypothetical protein A2Z34_02760 [Planctomycetes bacterium RBG_16_59_8]